MWQLTTATCQPTISHYTTDISPINLLKVQPKSSYCTSNQLACSNIEENHTTEHGPLNELHLEYGSINHDVCVIDVSFGESIKTPLKPSDVMLRPSCRHWLTNHACSLVIFTTLEAAGWGKENSKQRNSETGKRLAYTGDALSQFRQLVLNIPPFRGRTERIYSQPKPVPIYRPRNRSTTACLPGWHGACWQTILPDGGLWSSLIRKTRLQPASPSWPWVYIDLFVGIPTRGAR